MKKVMSNSIPIDFTTGLDRYRSRSCEPLENMTVMLLLRKNNVYALFVVAMIPRVTFYINCSSLYKLFSALTAHFHLLIPRVCTCNEHQVVKSAISAGPYIFGGVWVCI